MRGYRQGQWDLHTGFFSADPTCCEQRSVMFQTKESIHQALLLLLFREGSFQLPEYPCPTFSLTELRLASHPRFDRWGSQGFEPSHAHSLSLFLCCVSLFYFSLVEQLKLRPTCDLFFSQRWLIVECRCRTPSSRLRAAAEA